MPRCCMRVRAWGVRKSMDPRLRGGDVDFAGRKGSQRLERRQRLLADALQVPHHAEKSILHARELRLALFPDARESRLLGLELLAHGDEALVHALQALR